MEKLNQFLMRLAVVLFALAVCASCEDGADALDGTDVTDTSDTTDTDDTDTDTDITDTDDTDTDDTDTDITDTDDTSVDVSVKGVTQKGPFITGTQITISALRIDLSATGNSYQTQIKDDLGNFSIDFTTTGMYGEYIANGYYFDETTGNLSDSQLSLRAIGSISESVNINILTTLQIDRAKSLMTTEGITYSKASEQSHGEVLALFGITDSNVAAFGDMDISESGDSNSILLAISAALQQGRSVAEMSELISRLSLDLSDNGVVDNVTLIDSFRASSLLVDSNSVCERLEARYKSSGYDIDVADFTQYLSIMWSDNPIITFVSNGGSPVESQTTNYESSTATEYVPTLDGYTFAGWYTDADLTDLFDFVTPVTSDLTLYAKWTETDGDELPGWDYDTAW